MKTLPGKILDAIARADRPMRSMEIARAVERDSSTVQRELKRMREAGTLEIADAHSKLGYSYCAVGSVAAETVSDDDPTLDLPPEFQQLMLRWAELTETMRQLKTEEEELRAQMAEFLR